MSSILKTFVNNMSDLPIYNNQEIYKKSERIAAAIFLVSDKISDTENLKTKIRSLSLDLVSLCISIKDDLNYDYKNKIHLLEKNILELMALINITSISGLLSSMNASILRNEFEAFLKQAASLKSKYETRGADIPNNFFNVPNDIARNITVKDTSYYMPENMVEMPLKAIDKEHLNRKDFRTKNILDLIQSKGNVSIKDISTHIKGCSEKTVQRELNMLINKGIVKKTGERRWSRYSLK